jgi:hypothetical protein
VCDECAFKDENGAFCRRECAANYRSFKQAQARTRPAKAGSLLKAIVILILLAGAAVVVLAYGAKKGWFGEDAREQVENTEQRLVGEGE